MNQNTITSTGNYCLNGFIKLSSKKAISYTRNILIIVLFLNCTSSYADVKSDTVNHTYFSNHHPVTKTHYSLYLVFQLSNFLKPAYKVSFNFLLSKYDTTILTGKDLICDSLNPMYIYHYHYMSHFKYLSAMLPQTVFLLDENHRIISVDVVRSHEIKRLAHMYAIPLPTDSHSKKVHYYKLTGIAVAGVGDLKDHHVNNPMIRMTCKEKKKYYSEHGINGQHAMLGY